MVTAKTLAFDAETMEVRIIYEKLFSVYMNSLDDWLILTIKVNNQSIENNLLQEQAISTGPFLLKKTDE